MFLSDNGMGKEAIEEIIKRVVAIDFTDPKMMAEYERIEKENKELLESTKPDWETMHRTFDV